MNIKRSYFKLLFASVTVGAFLANCTVKESSSGDDSSSNAGKSSTTTGSSCTKGDKNSGCECSGNAVGYQVCGADGVYGSCVCPDGTTSIGGTTGTGGTTSTTYAGANDGGTPPVSAAEGGAGGAGDLSGIDPTDCNACLQQLCPTELAACLADEQCISNNVDGSGQYERISNCIETARVDGVVKRDAVRGCGVTIGASTDADLAIEWAPEGMSVNTTNLMNCLATSKSQTPNADWANSDDNFPVVNDMVVPKPWPADSCAGLACTSKL